MYNSRNPYAAFKYKFILRKEAIVMMTINTPTVRKATTFLTVIGAYVLLEYCEKSVFPFEGSFFTGAVIYFTLVANLAVAIFGFVTLVRWFYYRTQVFKRIRNKRNLHVQRRSQITCLICNPEGYDKKYEEEQLKRERRVAQKIDIV